MVHVIKEIGLFLYHLATRGARAAWLWCSKSPLGVSSRLGFTMRQLENCLCQPNIKLVPFFDLGKDKAAKDDGLAPPFISFAQDTVGH